MHGREELPRRPPEAALPEMPRPGVMCGRPPPRKSQRNGCGHVSGLCVRRGWPLAPMRSADRPPDHTDEPEAQFRHRNVSIPGPPGCVHHEYSRPRIRIGAVSGGWWLMTLTQLGYRISIGNRYVTISGSGLGQAGSRFDRTPFVCPPRPRALWAPRAAAVRTGRQATARGGAERSLPVRCTRRT
jgi:hypothetical protein